jgi:hypothetical protein
MPTRVIFSYSPAERKLFNRLSTLLEPLRKRCLIDDWDESRVQAGEDQHHARQAAWTQAGLFVLFLSPEYLASDLPAQLLSYSVAQSVPVLTVLARPCLWEYAPPPLHAPAPFTLRGDLDDALVELIRVILNRLAGERSLPRPAPTGYQHDLYISYRRRDPVSGWVRHHFLRLVSQWLRAELDYEPSIHADLSEEDTTSPTAAPERHPLLYARCLLAIWSPDYFRSHSCVSELATVLDREQRTGARLIYPVLFSDGDHLPGQLGPHSLDGRLRHDLRSWNCPHPGFAEMRGGVELDREIRKLAVELSLLIRAAPPWDPDWPLTEAAVQAAPHVPLLRIL